MKNEKRNIELRERFLVFSVNIFNFLKTIPYRREYDVLRFQLSKSATAIGANYEESQSSTYKEFVQKVRIALREANETKYWLSIIDRLGVGNNELCHKLMAESIELSMILGAIATKADTRLKTKTETKS